VTRSQLPNPARGKNLGKTESRLLKDIVIVLLTIAPIALVYLLPPDTSFAEVQSAGTLTACVPSNFPPLAMPQAKDPGFDIALLQEITRRLGISLTLNVNPLIGRDFNPRNWGITRAGCQVVAGGIAVTPTTRSFLETISTGIETGWAVIQKTDAPLKKGARIGVYPGYGGLDRVSLSKLLRQHGVAVTLVSSAEALAQGLDDGTFDAAVSESLSVRNLLEVHPAWSVAWLPDALDRASLGLGLWKGDLTLKARIVDAFNAMVSEGFVRNLATHYDIVPIEKTAVFAD
jgi:polar amino acid transport system substrate-binding protein/cystine transport system substrate-binding protein/membrane-bound lytic murein transglycosylase F